MEILIQIILAIIQGITEFLPISSSGHLALIQNYFGNVDVNLDIFLHLATLLSLLVFFSKDILNLIRGFFTFNKRNEEFRLAIFIIMASIPAAIFGFLIAPHIEKVFSNLYLVAFGFVITGLFLFNASLKKEDNKKLNLKNTFLIGLIQALAILPGISRSGSTVSTGILSGIKKEKAVRFSFLLAIPAIIGATILNLEDINFSPQLLLPFIICFLTGLASIHLFLKKITLKNFKYFAFYCWLLAILIFVLRLV